MKRKILSLESMKEKKEMNEKRRKEHIDFVRNRITEIQNLKKNSIYLVDE